MEATVILAGLGRRLRGLVWYILSLVMVLSPLVVLLGFAIWVHHATGGY